VKILLGILISVVVSSVATGLMAWLQSLRQRSRGFSRRANAGMDFTPDAPWSDGGDCGSGDSACD
jgi:hypothetical protein